MEGNRRKMGKAKNDALVPCRVVLRIHEREKRLLSRNTEANQSFQIEIGPGVYERVFLTYRNAVITAVKRVAGFFCTTASERNELFSI